ncbi:MAG: hypothetical protein KF729_29385 [Sandaracinaceae bacterium]|nr:hypothetical protein [Sandaracinaceae bacterium]
MKALDAVYGPAGKEALLEQSFRRGREEVVAHLKNGLRMALSSTAGGAFAAHLGQEAETLSAAIAKLHDPKQDPDQLVAERALLMRAEMAIDARVDAAVAAAFDRNGTWLRSIAMFLAVGAGMIVGGVLEREGSASAIGAGVGYGFLVGLAAVPIAPIAHDLVRLLNSARQALDRRQPS